MKLHLHLGQQDLAGYTNVDASQTSIDLANIQSLCDQAECIDLVVNDLLKFMPYEKLPEVVHHMSSRLRHGGKMTLIFTDLNSILREYDRGTVNEKLLNQLMFASGARSCFTHAHILNILRAIKLKVSSVEISKEQVIIIAERP